MLAMRVGSRSPLGLELSMRATAQRWGPITAVVAVLMLAWSGPIGRPALAQDPLFATMAVTHEKAEPEAPDFALRTPDGRTLTLSTFRGRIVLLNFWATWCAPCRVEMPSMERLHQDFKDVGLVILAVDLDESPKLVAKFTQDFRLTFPALLDTGSRVASRYEVRGLPTTILIDRRGRVVGTAIGPRDWASAGGPALIRSLLGQR